MNLNDSSSGIVGGTEVQEGSREMVSTVLLFDKARNSLCTGTLIDDQLVLTAGHCVDENSKEMVVIFAKKIEEVNLESVRPVVEIKRHEQYDPKIPKNLADVAMVKFEALPGLPDGYAPAKILSDWSLLQAQTKFIAAGYGINKAWIFKKGSGTLRTIELEISDPNFSETEVLIDQSLNRGVCSGDSGGPGYIDINGQLYLWGIVSRGDAIRFPLFPNCFLFSVYTRVDSYLSWISSARRELLNKGMN
jgi:secreted trypsin-like serine protease